MLLHSGGPHISQISLFIQILNRNRLPDVEMALMYGVPALYTTNGAVLYFYNRYYSAVNTITAIIGGKRRWYKRIMQSQTSSRVTLF
jgi:hypothetical protein